MAVAIITGSCGLVGSEAAIHFAELGYDVVGIDNNMRAQFFGKEASTAAMLAKLKLVPRYRHVDIDIRDRHAVIRTLVDCGNDISLVIHAAAQPSHDYATTDPLKDWSINATATAELLDAVHLSCPRSVFIFVSTNKVYGDRINKSNFEEHATRYDSAPGNWPIPEEFSINQSTHSLFGASKLAADILVQEYGRYFGMSTACFRCGCISGPNHAGVESHGFLSYLMKCALSKTPYTIYGYKGKQVRDNIHSSDLVKAFELFAKNPSSGAVFNIGGGRESNCSILEAIALSEEITGNKMETVYNPTPRKGDHIWWISDTTRFKTHYPGWAITRRVPDILKEIAERHKCVEQS